MDRNQNLDKNLINCSNKTLNSCKNLKKSIKIFKKSTRNFDKSIENYGKMAADFYHGPNFGNTNLKFIIILSIFLTLFSIVTSLKSIDNKNYENHNQYFNSYFNNFIDPKRRLRRFSSMNDQFQFNRRFKDITVAAIHNVSEDAPVDSIVANFQAYEKTPGDLYGTNYTFRIAHDSDVYRKFSIGPKDGIIKVAKPLDRELNDTYQLVIEVTDKDGHKGTNRLTIYINDVNDNAPDLNLTNVRLIIWEGEPPGFIGIVTAFDRDTKKNGPPFFMAQASNSQYLDLISVRFDNSSLVYENGFLNISSLKTLDREGPQGKILMVPIYTRDSGIPPQEAIRTLPIEIGDKNDNPMSDGTSTIIVYNYKGSMPITTVIGRVYVFDLDDWDVVDKEFTLKTATDYFTVGTDGIITMKKDTPLGKYKLETYVYDKVRKESATGTVHIIVDSIDDDAINNAGSVRIRGISAEDFLRPKPKGETSPYERFRKQLAESLKVDESNVKIFSVMTMPPPNQWPPYVELYFAVVRSDGEPGYLSPVMLTGVIERYRTKFEEALEMIDLNIVWVNIDDCVLERCTGGGCTRHLTAVTEYPAVIMANKTSLVGVNLTATTECMCPRQSISPRCTKDTCYNGGICHNAQPGFFCECRGPFNNGSRCEGRTRSFSANGFAWLKPIGSCDNFTLAFEFMTKSSDAILLYNGPMREKRLYDNFVTDLLAIQLRNGRIEIKVNLGGASTMFSLNETVVNDGEWHTLDIIASRLKFEITLDHCRKTENLEQPPNFSPSQNGPNSAASNVQHCKTGRKLATALGSNEQLNVDDPLQLGGVASVDGTAYDSGLVRESMIGCMRNLRINGELYDLANSGVVYAEQSEIGCSHTDVACVMNLGEAFCMHGECVASMSGLKKCICEIGWYGERCDIESKWKSFSPSSFIQYSLMDPSNLSPVYSNVRALFLPLQTNNGDVIRIRGFDGQTFMQANLNNGRVEYNYNFGTGKYGISPQATVASSNFSYLIDVERFGTYSRITLDGLTDPFTDYRIGSYDENNIFSYDQNGIFLGADSAQPTPQNDFQGCIKEFYFNDLFIPVAESNENAKLLSMSGVSDSCPAFLTCASAGFQCPAPFMCVDFWKGPFCSCPQGIRPVLRSDGTLEGCGGNTQALRVGITHSAIAAIFISLLALIILVLLLVVYSRRRRKMPSSDDNLISNVGDYKEEGGGEADQLKYNIVPLRKPVFPVRDQLRTSVSPQNGSVGTGQKPKITPRSVADLDAFLNERLKAADLDAYDSFYDEIRTYAVEADGISVASLSSLDSTGSDIDWDELNEWGPRFKNVADMYDYEKDENQ